MIYTREQLIERIKKNDTDFFEQFYNEYFEDEECENKYDNIWTLNWGDGNELLVAIEFPNEKLTVLLEGTYSSHDSNYWDKVSFGVPYEFKETRYKSATLADIRDMKIDDVLNG